mmetsp:Transcript_57372/g.103133  ORF Transcript_57372/g.103133 Transcript_57372/m.103133 type:complete len:88 (+) Transcript_57372:856-1119(+)
MPRHSAPDCVLTASTESINQACKQPSWACNACGNDITEQEDAASGAVTQDAQNLNHLSNVTDLAFVPLGFTSTLSERLRQNSLSHIA